MRKFKAAVVSLALLLTPFLILAEEDEFVEVHIGGANEKATGVDCFDHYEFGSIGMDMSSDKSDYKAGDTVSFEGRLKNNNSYPVTGGGLHVQIFRSNDDYQKKAGSDMIEEFFAEEDIAIAANSSGRTSFEWQIPEAISGGDYFAAVDFVVDRSLNLTGAPILEGVHGELVHFTVESDEAGDVIFNKERVTVNGEQFLSRDFVPKIEEGERVSIDYVSKNLSEDHQSVTINERLYYWDNLKEENLLKENSHNLAVGPRSESSRSVDLGDLDPGTYLLELSTESDSGVPAKMNIRFSVEGAPLPSRINFYSLENFPLQAGETGYAFVCFHSVADKVTGEQEVLLELTDSEGNIIKEIDYKGEISPGMMAIREEFTADKDYNDLSLSATVYNEEGEVIDSSTLNYAPENFGAATSVSVEMEEDELVISALDMFDNPVEAEMAIEVKDREGETVFFEPSFSGEEFRKDIGIDKEKSYEVTVLTSEEGLKESGHVGAVPIMEEKDDLIMIGAAIFGLLVILVIIFVVVYKKRSKI